MVTYVTRAQWGARASRGSTSLVPSQVKNVAFHWPGSAKGINAVGDDGFRRVCSALRGWQAYHMDGRGWSDIAYQIAIDQEGRAYTLRGINIRSGANGDGTVNRIYGAILLVLGPGEQMSAKMKATSRAVVADYRKRYAAMPKRPTWHGAVRAAGTTCPGPVAIAAIKAGQLDAGATPSSGGTMAFDTTEVNQIRAACQAENEEYAIRFWIDGTGTGKAMRDLLSEMKLQLDRIEDDTDSLATSRQLLAALDANVEALAARPLQTALVEQGLLPKEE